MIEFCPELLFLQEALPRIFEKHLTKPVEVDAKGSFDVVTNVDKAIEEDLIASIKKLFPADSIHSEEFNSSAPLDERTWIIDPIDGTYNFSTGSDYFGLQCAFWYRDSLLCAVIFLPKLKEFYMAEKGKGAFLNGARTFVSKREAKDAIVSFGDFPHARQDDVIKEKEIMNRAIPSIARLRMFGAASIDYAFVASGRTEGAVLFTKNKWDLACGWLICSEAGAVVKGLGDKPYSFQERALCIANTKELYDLLFNQEKL